MQTKISNNPAVMLTFSPACSAMSWLKTTGAFLLIASCFSPWLDLSIRGSDGFSIYQTFALGLCCVVVVSILIRSQSLTLICGALCLVLTSLALFKLALFQNFLRELVFENHQYTLITSFTKTYFVPNLNVEPYLSSGLHLETFMKRIDAAIYFQGSGWWLALAAGLLLTISTVHMVKRAKLSILALSCVFAVLAVGYGAGVGSQYRWEREKVAVALGEYGDATVFFQKIIDEDNFLYDKEKSLLALGEISMLSGKLNSPEALFYQGHKSYTKNDFNQARSRLLLAYENTSGDQKEIIAKYLAATLGQIGLVQYKKNGIGLAILAWQSALAMDPSQFSAHFFLGKGYYDLQDYEQSLEHYRYLYDLSTDKLLNSNVMAGIGDNYWSQKLFNEARAAYETAMRLDDKGNLRVIKDLGGT